MMPGSAERAFASAERGGSVFGIPKSSTCVVEHFERVTMSGLRS